MKILLDHCVPRLIGPLLTGHEYSTTQRMGWARLKNGVLLNEAAGAGFDALLTVDQNLAYQTNPRTLTLAVVVLDCRSNLLNALTPFIPNVLRLLDQPLDKQVYLVRLSAPT